MNTQYRKGIRTGRCWLSCAARSTKHKATPGRTAGSRCCRSPISQRCGGYSRGWTCRSGCKNRTTTARSGHEHEQQTDRLPGREEYRNLDNRVTCILLQRWPANDISQWVGMLQDKQQAVACAIFIASLVLSDIPEVPIPFQARANRPTVPVLSADGSSVGRRHIMEGLTHMVIDQSGPMRCTNTGHTLWIARPNGSTRRISQHCTRWWLPTAKSKQGKNNKRHTLQ